MSNSKSKTPRVDRLVSKHLKNKRVRTFKNSKDVKS